MKQILSEKNIAALLFVLVMVVFSFAHEDSKRRSENYTVSTNKNFPTSTSVSNNLVGKNFNGQTPSRHLPVVK